MEDDLFNVYTKRKRTGSDVISGTQKFFPQSLPKSCFHYPCLQATTAGSCRDFWIILCYHLLVCFIQQIQTSMKTTEQIVKGQTRKDRKRHS